MSRREATKKKRSNSRAVRKPTIGRRIRLAPSEQHTGTEASELPRSGLLRRPKTLKIFHQDLDKESAEYLSKQWVLSIDTETGGLDPRQHPLLLVQICTINGEVFMVRFPDGAYSVNLMLLLLQKHLTWIFHHAMFDLKFLQAGMHVQPAGKIECTKTMMKLVRPDLPSGLGNALKAILGVEINKKIRHDWSKPDLTERDVEYASDDVLYLHDLLAELRLQSRLGDTPKYERAIETICNIAAFDIEGYTDLFMYEQDPLEKRTAQRAWWSQKETTTLLGLIKEIERIDKEKANERV